MKEEQKPKKKLTTKDYEQMWGEDGPYSQVRLCEETRILDDSVSRVFLVVEAEINPFTFEYVQKNRRQFVNDEALLQLLDHAEYRGDFGYVVSAGEVELQDEESKRFARKQANMTIQTLIRMHTFVINECGLRQDTKYGVIEDLMSHDDRFVWNEGVGKAEPVPGGLWSNETFIGSPAGIQNNKARFFFALAFEKNFDFKKESAVLFSKILKKISISFKVEIENVESFQEYVLITVLLPFDVVPASFIETVLDQCIMIGKKSIFKKDYFVTNVKKPTPEQIMSFLKQLPLDRDIEMPL